MELFDPSGTKSVQDIVLEAGKNCYTTMKKLFSEAGYDRFFMAVGDHELGDNGWIGETEKLKSLPQYRQSFVHGFNRDPQTNEFLYQTPIGSAPASPIGTPFVNTSYAYQHKNALFITVDAFTTIDTDKKRFIDKKEGIGGEGIIMCTVVGDHLDWFIRVLEEAKNVSSIDHIFVQAHVPIIQPVRKISTSAVFFNYGDDSEFWNAMADHGVDIYFAGEVHANTVTRDSHSNLIQVVSRGNMANNFLSVEIQQDMIVVSSYDEIGDQYRFNNNYTKHGELRIIKPKPGVAWVKSNGALEVLDRYSSLMHFDFEGMVPLSSRPVIGMVHDQKDVSRIGESVTMADTVCRHSLPNQGTFGQQYDAQVANIELEEGNIGNKAGKFDETSRFGIYSTGPHSGGDIISYTIWIKTLEEDSEMIIIHYGSVFNHGKVYDKNIFTVTLNNGIPNLYTGVYSKLVPEEDSLNIADGKWHHIAVSMPKRSCLLSNVMLAVDGRALETYVSGYDDYIFFLSTGRISLGNLGYSTRQYEAFFPDMKPFIGLMDDFYMWGRTLERDELQLSMRGEYQLSWAKACKRKEGQKILDYEDSGPWKCRKRCSKQKYCWGYESIKGTGGNKSKCTLFYGYAPEVGESQAGSRCARIV